MNKFSIQVKYFIAAIDRMPDDIVDIWPEFCNNSTFFGLGINPLIEFKKYSSIDDYEIIYLPAPNSEQALFRDLIWVGTWESLTDIYEAKCKKLKFLNDVKSVKQRYLAALKFMDEHGPRSGYWSKNENPEDSYVA